MNTVPITEHLSAAGCAFRAVRFDPTLSVEGASDVIGLPVASVCKTLAVASMPAVVLVVLPYPAQLDLDALRQHLGENRSMLLNAQALERMTGFVPGAVTPLSRPGQRRFRVVVDASLMALLELSVGGGEAGLEIVMAPQALVAAADAEVADIVTVS